MSDRVVSVLAGLALFLAVVVPPEVWARLPALCPSRWVGRTCGGCGMTRAMSLLLHGRPRQALSMNPGVVVVAPLLGWLAGRGFGLRRW